MKPLISVIIPVYKVEDYLEQCVRSVAAQSYSPLEIILVDDGSPDRCGSICDALAAEDERIKVIHKPNGGLSDARNKGVEASRGEYVSFVDSDDYVSPHYIEYLYRLMVDNKAQLSCCELLRCDSRELDFPEEDGSVELLSGREACVALSKPNQYSDIVTAPCKLIARSLALRHPFPPGRKHEDEATTYKYFYECERIALGSRVLYAYWQNPESIMHKRPAGRNDDAVLAFAERAEFFRQQGDGELAKLFCGEYIRYLLQQCAFRDGSLRPVLVSAVRQALKHRLISAKLAVWISVFFLSPALYKRLLAKRVPDAAIIKEQNNGK